MLRSFYTVSDYNFLFGLLSYVTTIRLSTFMFYKAITVISQRFDPKRLISHTLFGKGIKLIYQFIWVIKVLTNKIIKKLK